MYPGLQTGFACDKIRHSIALKLEAPRKKKKIRHARILHLTHGSRGGGSFIPHACVQLCRAARWRRRRADENGARARARAYISLPYSGDYSLWIECAGWNSRDPRRTSPYTHPAGMCAHIWAARALACMWFYIHAPGSLMQAEPFLREKRQIARSLSSSSSSIFLILRVRVFPLCGVSANFLLFFLRGKCTINLPAVLKFKQLWSRDIYRAGCDFKLRLEINRRGDSSRSRALRMFWETRLHGSLRALGIITDKYCLAEVRWNFFSSIMQNSLNITVHFNTRNVYNLKMVILLFQNSANLIGMNKKPNYSLYPRTDEKKNRYRSRNK